MKTKGYLSIEYLKIEQLQPSPNNARIHSKHQIQQIAKSIGAFGFLCPLLVDKFNNVLTGHGRLEAAKVRGMKEVPVIRVEDLSPAQCRAFTIADNRLAENSEWDAEKLAIELGQLLELEGLNFDVTVSEAKMGKLSVRSVLINRPMSPNPVVVICESAHHRAMHPLTGDLCAEIAIGNEKRASRP